MLECFVGQCLFGLLCSLHIVLSGVLAFSFHVNFSSQSLIREHIFDHFELGVLFTTTGPEELQFKVILGHVERIIQDIYSSSICVIST